MRGAIVLRLCVLWVALLAACGLAVASPFAITNTYPTTVVQPDKATISDGTLTIDCRIKVLDKGAVQPECDLQPFGFWDGPKTFSLVVSRNGNAAAPVAVTVRCKRTTYNITTAVYTGQKVRMAVVTDIYSQDVP